MVRHELAVKQSLNNMLLGKETPEEFLDKLEATGAVVMDEYLADILDNLEDVGIFNQSFTRKI
ncbi:MAG: hypothetical protein SWX82_01475 [Cyanobacteriota bacterium]|nr:hypothetical protein [Cyanobacteriota bacterium]